MCTCSPLAFVSLLQNTARSSGAITNIEDDLAAGCAAGCSAILDDSELFSMSSLLMLVAARRRGAARRRLRRLHRRRRAAATSGQVWRSARAHAAAPAMLLLPRMPSATAYAVLKKWRATDRPISRCVHVCACGMYLSDAFHSPVHEGMRGIA